MKRFLDQGACHNPRVSWRYVPFLKAFARYWSCAFFIGCIALRTTLLAAETPAVLSPVAFSIVESEASLFQVVGNSLISVSSVSPKTMLAVLSDEKQFELEGSGHHKMRSVRVIEPRVKLSGWMRSSDLKPLQITASEESDAGANSARLPTIISLASPAIKQAWRDVRVAIDENGSLAKPLPDPYFSRAQIWAATNSNDEALRDYMTAFRLSLESGQDLQSYSQHFFTLYQVLDNYDKIPRPPVAGNSHSHYGRGTIAYFEGDLQRALGHLNDAVQLDPKEPVYRYFRAVIFKRLGDDRRAQHDALFGAHLEEQAAYTVSLGGAFTRVQGDIRLWLENYRRGSPSQSVLAR